MPNTSTPVLGLVKPEVKGAETENVWGFDINDNFDKLDSNAGGLAGDISDLEGRVSTLEIGALPVAPVPSGRLSLSSVSAFTGTSDILAATTLWYVDIGGGFIPIWDGTRWQLRRFSGALQLPLDALPGHTLYHEAGRVFDVYAFWDVPTLSLKIATSGQWSLGSWTARGANVAGLVALNGILVNTVPAAMRWADQVGDFQTIPANQATYLGSVGTVAAGQIENSYRKRLVFNVYNARKHLAYVHYTGGDYAYSTATWRQVAADTAMQVEVLSGVAENDIEASALHFAVCSAVSTSFNTGIGIDSNTIDVTASPLGGLGSAGRSADTTFGWPTHASWTGYPGLGRRTVRWLELGPGGAPTVTWQTADGNFRGGLRVSVEQ